MESIAVADNQTAKEFFAAQYKPAYDLVHYKRIGEAQVTQYEKRGAAVYKSRGELRDAMNNNGPRWVRVSYLR